MTDLSPQDLGVLDIEARFWKHQGTKEAAIRAELDMTPIRYYQALRRLAGHPEAIAAAPVVTARVRRTLGARRG